MFNNIGAFITRFCEYILGVRDFVITQFGDSKITVGGVKLLLDFLPDEISLRVGGGIVTIAGENLMIERFDENEITIIGKINGVTNNAAV